MYRFKLTYSGTDTTIEEPRGWTTFKSELKRDFKSHGVIFNYTSGSLKLEFADGRSILEDAFQLEGFDAVVTLTVDQRSTINSSWANTFVGNAVMKNRELTDSYFAVDFEGDTFKQKIVNRLDTPVRLDSVIDLDGGSLVGSINSYSDQWNSIRLNSDYVADYKTGGDSSLFNNFTNSPSAFSGSSTQTELITVNFDGTLQEDLKEFQTVGEQIAVTIAGANNFIIAENGDLKVVATDIKFRWQGTLTTSSASALTVNAEWTLRVDDYSGANKSETAIKTNTYSTSGSPLNYDTGVVTESFTETTVSVVAGDLVYIYLKLEAVEHTGVGAGIASNSFQYDLYESSRLHVQVLKSIKTQV